MIIITSGVYSPKLLSRKDGPISLPEAEEARLIALGVASPVLDASEFDVSHAVACDAASSELLPTNDTAKVENASEGVVEAQEEITDVENMSFAQLKAVASQMGIDTGKLRSKQALIEAIEAESGPDLTDCEDVVV